MMRLFNRLRRLSNVGPVIIVLVALILVLIWFRKGLIMGGGESGLPFYNPIFYSSESRYIWAENVLGGTAPNLITGFLTYFVLGLLAQAGISGVVLQAVTFFVILVVGGLSVYYLTITVARENRKEEFLKPETAALFAAIFYLFNPYAMTTIWNRFQYTYMFFYALAPLALFLYIKGLQRSEIRYAFYFALVSVAYSYAFGSVPSILTIWILVATYFLFYLVTNIREKPKILFLVKFSFASFSLWVTLNLWWLLPFLGTAGQAASARPAISPSINIWTLVQISNPILNVLRLLPDNWQSFLDIWGSFYRSLPFQLFSFSIPLLVFSTVFIKRKNRLVIYFLAISVFSLFIAKGVKPPLGDVFMWAFKTYSITQVFRNPFEKLGNLVLLGYAPLVGIALSRFMNYVQQFFSKRKETKSALLGIAIVVLLFLTPTWPLWTGRVFTSGEAPMNNPSVGYNVEVPAYYREASEWLSKQKGNFRVLVLPLDGEGITYRWRYGYSGVELSNLLLSRPSISITTYVPHIDEVIVSINRVLSNPVGFGKLMTLLNVRYVVVRSDIDFKVRKMIDPEVVRRSVEKLDYVRYVRSFGKLAIYELDESLFVPRIYPATKSIFLLKGVDSLVDALKTEESTRDTVFFSLTTDEARRVLAVEELRKQGGKPNVEYEMINPTLYRAKIRNASRPFHLVLSESYHPEWRVYRGNVNWFDALWQKPMGEERHWRVNEYANSWYLNEQGDFELTLYFWPQSLVYLGGIVSGITFVGSMGFLFYDWRRKWVLARR